MHCCPVYLDSFTGHSTEILKPRYTCLVNQNRIPYSPLYSINVFGTFTITIYSKKIIYIFFNCYAFDFFLPTRLS